MKQRKEKSILSLLLVLALLLGGCGAASPSGASAAADPEAAERANRYVDSMDTIIELTAYGSGRETALDAATAEILRLNDLLSIGLEDSEVSRLNREGSGKLGPDAAYLVGRALEIYDSTGGAFDPTVYPLMVLWGFTGESTMSRTTRSWPKRWPGSARTGYSLTRRAGKCGWTPGRPSTSAASPRAILPRASWRSTGSTG